MASAQMEIPSVHVFTDIGVEDTDDELGVKYLLNFKDPLNVLIVFTGSASMSAGNALAYWVRNFESTVLSKMTPGTTFAYATLSDYAAADSNCCEYGLQIGPLKGYDGANMTVNKKYVFAGDYKTPEGARPSFNRAGSEKILDKFFGEGKLIDIPSAHMVKMRFSKELLSKFSTDADDPFASNIVFTAFLLIFARMSPDHAANKFAEGLINPNCGRGANYTSVRKLCFELLGVDVDFLRSHEDLLNETGACLNIKSCVTVAENYCSALEKNGVTLKDKEGTIKYLTDVNIMLQCIADKGREVVEFSEPVDIFDRGSQGMVYVSDFDVDNIPCKLENAWELFKKNAESLTDCFNPVYDLFAAYVLTGLIVGENRVTHTPDEFLEKIVQEF
tara:strand:+ start:563 stop:1729 length:1167 start_codon:yes stop_codon:yes gene_type:complete